MLSILPAVRERFRSQYAAAPLDVASFYRRYKVCGANECAALCCNGGCGFYYENETDVVRALITQRRDFFAPRGITADNAFDPEIDEETGKVELSTNTREIAYPEGMLPPHFPSTACVFRDPNGACSLQLLGLSEGRDGWHYKPLACWLYPIELERKSVPLIHVAHHGTDEYVDDEYPGFVGFTKCGAECADGGRPAYEVLRKEIMTLSEWLGRDLMREILAYEQRERVA